MLVTSTSVKGCHGRAILVFCAWLVAVTHVAALPQASVAIRANITGTNDCQSPDAFLDQVQARTIHARRANSGEVSWSASVTVKKVGSRRLARLKLMASEGEWIERELVAPNCYDALEALAVVLAVLVDTAVEQAPHSAQGGTATGDEAAVPMKPMALPRVATGVYIPWIDDPDYFEKRGISLSPTRFIPRIAGGVELDTQLMKKAAFGIVLGFEVERWSPSLLRPTFGLSLGWAPGDTSALGQSAGLQRWSLGALLCPFELLQSRVVSLRPCARIEGGFVYLDPYESGARSERLGRVRTSPYLRMTLAPAAGAQLRIDSGIDLLVTRHRIGDETPAALGPYLALAVAVEY